MAKLAANLVTNNNYSLLPHSMEMKKQYPKGEERDIAGKGVFPYTYVDGWKKLEEKGLLSFEYFYDVLEESISITKDDYKKAQ